MDENKVIVTFKWPYEGKDVEVTGSFYDWKKNLRLHKEDSFFTTRDRISPGTYQYKFIVDGKWYYDVMKPYTNNNGNVNNVLEVKPLLDPGSQYVFTTVETKTAQQTKTEARQNKKQDSQQITEKKQAEKQKAKPTEDADKKAKEEKARKDKAEADKEAKEEKARKDKEDADKKAKEEKARKDKAEADKKAKAEADKKAKEEEEERKALEKAEKKAAEEVKKDTNPGEDEEERIAKQLFDETKVKKPASEQGKALAPNKGSVPNKQAPNKIPAKAPEPEPDDDDEGETDIIEGFDFELFSGADSVVDKSKVKVESSTKAAEAEKKMAEKEAAKKEAAEKEAAKVAAEKEAAEKEAAKVAAEKEAAEKAANEAKIAAEKAAAEKTAPKPKGTPQQTKNNPKGAKSPAPTVEPTEETPKTEESPNAGKGKKPPQKQPTHTPTKSTGQKPTSPAPVTEAGSGDLSGSDTGEVISTSKTCAVCGVQLTSENTSKSQLKKTGADVKCSECAKKAQTQPQGGKAQQQRSSSFSPSNKKGTPTKPVDDKTNK